MNYWALIVETHPDYHVLHTFLSHNLSFPSLSSVTSLIMPTNHDPVLMDSVLVATWKDFKCTSDIGCSKIIAHTVQQYCAQLSIPVL